MALTRTLYRTKDNVECQLNAGIGASDLAIPLKSGHGAQLPSALKGAATSGGDSNSLNSTGIQAALSGIAAVGDIIENVTDGSVAVILSISTDAIETTRLRGGSDNTWSNADVWAVNRFVATAIHYDTDGTTILKREKILIDSRSGDNLTVNASGRGFDGSTAQSFATDDYIYLFWTTPQVDGALQIIAQLATDIDTHTTDIATLNSTKANDADVVHDTGTETIAGTKTFSSSPVVPTPTNSDHATRKDYVDSKAAKFGGTGTDGALTTAGGTVNIDLGNAAYVEKNYTSITVTSNNLTFTNPHANGTVIVLRSQGDVVISATIDASGLGAAGGATSGANGSDSGWKFDQASTVASGGSGTTAGAAGTIWAWTNTYTDDSNKIHRGMIIVAPGSGGGAGQTGGAINGGVGGTLGAGGRGGAGLYIECGGAWNFTGTINVSGAAGGNGGNGTPNSGAATGGSGGGGGSGGQLLVLYGTLTANSGTVNKAGGNGGNGGNGSGGSGDPGAGKAGGGGASRNTTAGGIGGSGIGSGGPGSGNSGATPSGGGTGGTGGTSSGNGAGGSGGGGGAIGQSLITQNLWK